MLHYPLTSPGPHHNGSDRGGDVESLQRIAQALNGKITHQVVKCADRVSDFSGVADAVDGIEGPGIADEADRTPK